MSSNTCWQPFAACIFAMNWMNVRFEPTFSHANLDNNRTNMPLLNPVCLAHDGPTSDLADAVATRVASRAVMVQTSG